MKRLATRLLAVGALVAVLALGSATLALACTCPLRSDRQCIATGDTGVGSPYWLGHGCWRTTDRSWGGADCSGFLTKCWQVPHGSPTGEDYHPYSTGDIFEHTYHWYGVSRGNAVCADAIGYPPPAGALYGHVMMYCSGNPYGSAFVMEATGSHIQKHYRDVSGSQWHFRRRHNLYSISGPLPPY